MDVLNDLCKNLYCAASTCMCKNRNSLFLCFISFHQQNQAKRNQMKKAKNKV